MIQFPARSVVHFKQGGQFHHPLSNIRPKEVAYFFSVKCILSGNASGLNSEYKYLI